MLLDEPRRLRVRSPRSIHAAAVDSLPPPGASAIDGSDDGLGEARGRLGQCRPSSGSTQPGRLSLTRNASAGIDARSRARR